MKGNMPNSYFVSKISSRKRLIMFAAMIFIAAGFWFILRDTGHIAYAADSQVRVTVDYLEETATVMAGSGASTKFYYSADNKKTWNYIDADTGSGGAYTVDISVLLKKKAISIFFKGNRDLNPATMKASYQATGGIGTIVITNTSLPVEYRKGNNGQWKAVSNPSYLLYTSKYETKGVTLYFRTVATAARRAGAIVSVKVPKRASAPSVKLDGGKLQITGLKSGQTEYRVGDATTWTTFVPASSSVKGMDLAALLSAAGTPANFPLPAGLIEFRTKATDKKAASAVRVLEIPAQPSAPTAVSLVGTALSVQDNTPKRTYEYTRVEKNGTLNIQTAKWSSLTASRAVIIPKASVGDRIYVRIKSATDSATKLTVPASACLELPITSITIK